MASLEGKVVLITGASSGIGRSTAVAFAGRGARLVLGGRNAQRLQETKDLCLKAECKDDHIALEVGDMVEESSLVRLAESPVRRFGQLDVLVNNAGIPSRGDSLTTSLAAFDQVMQVNLRAVIALCQSCSLPLIRSKGCIVNVSSVASLRASGSNTFYSVSKAALDQYTRCLALELAPKGVRVNSVNPGVIETPIFEVAGFAKESYPAMFEAMKRGHALGRIGQPGEVADAIVFLASSSSTFITGQTLSIDGGRAILPPLPH